MSDPRSRALGIGIIGAGTMAGVHGAALVNLGHLYPTLPIRPRLVAVADVNPSLAHRWPHVSAGGASRPTGAR